VAHNVVQDTHLALSQAIGPVIVGSNHVDFDVEGRHLLFEFVANECAGPINDECVGRSGVRKNVVTHGSEGGGRAVAVATY
jgi:hypothetical protein